MNYKRLTRILFSLTILILTSCAPNKHIFKEERFTRFENLKIGNLILLEKRLGSEDTTPEYPFSISDGIYPNKNGFNLSGLKTFTRKERPCFEYEVDYFYTTTDSSVKVILYEWKYLPNENNDYFKNKEEEKKNAKKFQEKFDNLRKELTIKLGQPTEIEIEQNRVTDENFRDGLKWINPNGLNAYLFMLGNKDSGYRKVRLAIYKD